jgi:hypothetical protein
MAIISVNLLQADTNAFAGVSLNGDYFGKSASGGH